MTDASSPDAARVEGGNCWPPAIALTLLVILLHVLRGHAVFLPVWLSWVGLFAILAAMAAVTLTRGNVRCLRIERALIMLLGAVYVVNTAAELADMVGVIAIHPKGENAYALLSSAVGIWVENVVIFSLLYWQIDGGGPYGRAQRVQRGPDWGFPTPPTTEGAPSAWTPQYVDYLFPRLQHGHGVQPDGSVAVHAPREDADDGGERDFAGDACRRAVARDRHSAQLR